MTYFLTLSLYLFFFLESSILLGSPSCELAFKIIKNESSIPQPLNRITFNKDPRCSDADGAYIVNKNEILICSANFKTNIILHEVGHHIDFNLPDHVRKVFHNMSWMRVPFTSHLFKVNDNFITDYASKSPNEDFAESFSYFMLSKEFMQEKIPDKFSYFNKLLRCVYNLSNIENCMMM